MGSPKMQCKKEEIRTHASIKNREEEKEERGVEERGKMGIESGTPGEWLTRNGGRE